MFGPVDTPTTDALLLDAHALSDQADGDDSSANGSESAPPDAAQLLQDIEMLLADAESALPAEWLLDDTDDYEAEEDAEMAEADDDDAAGDAAHARERELLEREITFLEAQRAFLQFKADAAAATIDAARREQSAAARRAAEEAKRNLEVAERHKQMLADLSRQHVQSLQELQLLVISPINHYRLTLMTPMESHIKLCRDPAKRRATLLALRDAKIDSTRQFIEFQALHIDPEREFFYLDTFEKFDKFFTVDFSVSKLHQTTVEDAAAIIQDHFVTSNDGISQMLGSTTNREFFDAVDQTFLHCRTVDRVDVPKRHPLDRGFVVQESNTVFYRKNLGDVTVMMADYIDDDELYPYRASGRIRKDISVGIVLSPQVNTDGSSSVVMKRFTFIKHHFLAKKPSPEVLQAISTRVILWGQAVRSCIIQRRRPKQKAIWLNFRDKKLWRCWANDCDGGGRRFGYIYR
ncbi:hypothetical protein PybrP1_003481 [[Pythium] brassicae (nom. inval.)]|nr:hypothetical protein PybrP1_003481 [[Pythium] brassicae (nom. inval.)]